MTRTVTPLVSVVVAVLDGWVHAGQKYGLGSVILRMPP
jgi:hypothetical protein